MNFNPKTEEELKAMIISHGGIYDFEVTDAKDDVSSKGNDMIALKLDVFTIDGTPNKMRDWLVGSDAPLCIAKLQQFCKATGMMEHYTAGTLTAEMCVGLGGKLRVQATESPQYGKQFGVGEYLANNAAVPQEPPKGVPAEQTRRANKAAEDRILAAMSSTGVEPDPDIPF